MTQPLDNFEHGRLVANARTYKPDPALDHAADLLEADPAAWRELHPLIRDRSQIHAGFRRNYRAAVRAGLVPDDRSGPSAA